MGDGYQIKTLVAVGGASAPGMATFVFDPAGVQPKDKPITLTATPATGYEFDSPVWTLSGGMESQSIDITTGTISYTNPGHNNWTATANVKKTVYTVTTTSYNTTASDNGGPAVTVSSPVVWGESVTLTVPADDAAWKFTGWDLSGVQVGGDTDPGFSATDFSDAAGSATIDGDDGDPKSITFTMPIGNVTGITANFVSLSLAQLVQTTGGTITSNDASVTAGETVTFTATGDNANTADHQFFVEWNVTGTTITDIQKRTNPLTIKVDNVTTVSATFDGGVVFALSTGNITWARANLSDFKKFADEETIIGAYFQWGSMTGVPYYNGGTPTGADSSVAAGGLWPAKDGQSAGQGPCPTGWRLPTSIEWANMINLAGFTNGNKGVFPGSTYNFTKSGSGNVSEPYKSGEITGSGKDRRTIGGFYLQPVDGATQKTLFMPAGQRYESGNWSEIHCIWCADSDSATNGRCGQWWTSYLKGAQFSISKTAAYTIRCVHE